MKKIRMVGLLSAILMFGSCAREYPVFNQMPANAYHSQKVETIQPHAAERITVGKKASEKYAFGDAESEPLSDNPEVVKMLTENSPRQIDEQLESALATTQGQTLMAKPLVAAQINKARKLIAQNELRNAPLSDVQTSKASKLIHQTLKNHLDKHTLAPAAAQELNRYLKIGLILLGVGVVLGLIPGIRGLGAIAGLVGVVFIVLGLLEM